MHITAISRRAVSIRPSVRLSVTVVYICIGTIKHVLKLFSSSGNPTNLGF